MFYRVRADLPFNEFDEAKDFYHDCMVALPKSSIINPGHEEQEGGHIIMELCYHDEDPGKPCTPVQEDFNF